MVRRAVLKGLETADLRHVLLHPEMVALNPLLEMFGHIMHGSGWRSPSSTDVLIVDGKVLAPSVPILLATTRVHL